MRLLRAALTFGGLLPWLRALGDRALPVSARQAIDQAFSSVCHHIPERTLSLFGTSMCICSRCAGLYAGVAVAALLSWRPRVVAIPILKRLLHIGVLLAAADMVTQDLGLHAPWHVARLLTGAWVGGALTSWMLAEVAAG
jgi:uncharacterized membrane protein